MKKFLVPLILLVLLPVVLLSLAAWRLVQNERAALALQWQDLIAVQLHDIDNNVQDYFQRQQQQLEQALAELNPADSAELQLFKLSYPGLLQLWVLDKSGARLYPAGDLSLAEQQWLERTESFWQTYGRSAQLQARSPENRPEGLQLTPLQEAAPAEPAISPDLARRQGWYVWQWGDQTHLIYWWQDPDQQLWVVELEPSYVLAELIALLPATPSRRDSNSANARIQLHDASGALQYQWGDYQPSGQQQPLLQRPLSYPLGSWTLNYYGAPLNFGQAALGMTSMAIIAVVTLALAVLAWLLYREHRREYRLAQQRVNFVNQVSHELKTPLTSIRMYAELLEQSYSDEDTSTEQRYLRVIVSESQRLSRLINNVLSFAGWQKGRLKLRPRPACLDDIVQNAAQTFTPLLSAKQITLTLELNVAKTFRLDADVIEQIVHNLLGNVEKYVPAGGHVSIRTEQQAKMLIISVQDNGKGIPKREQQRIFQPFYRMSSALTEGVSGAGLGLSISRQLARLHGGDLVLKHSTQGACFQIRILPQ